MPTRTLSRFSAPSNRALAARMCWASRDAADLDASFVWFQSVRVSHWLNWAKLGFEHYYMTKMKYGLVQLP